MITALVDLGLVPDVAVRAGIRAVVRGRLAEQESGGDTGQARRLATFLDRLATSPVADSPAAANAQHYEVPAAFFEQVLGPRLKYSCAWWPEGVTTLAEAETGMLALSAERAMVEDGHRILDLGCGWGSMTIYLAQTLPASQIVAVSNSTSQRRFIESRLRALRLTNVEVVTADVNTFDATGRFDRIVSIEMLEHVRNYPRLFARIAGWLTDGGRMFAHVFSHRRFAYTFEDTGDSDWMARHFFTGGVMPSADLFHRFADHLVVDDTWQIDGDHYRLTAEAWLQNMDRNRVAVDEALVQAYGAEARRWHARWRVFFMACAEMFGYRGGSEWGVTHYRFSKRSDR